MHHLVIRRNDGTIASVPPDQSLDDLVGPFATP
jgi:hypothetical protein